MDQSFKGVVAVEHVTPEQLMNTVVVILAILAAIVAVDKAIDVFKKWRQPTKSVNEKLETDKRRLDEHEKAIRNLTEGQKVMCAGVVALLDHQLHNGNTEQMENARNDISKYLNGLIG